MPNTRSKATLLLTDKKLTDVHLHEALLVLPAALSEFVGHATPGDVPQPQIDQPSHI